MSKKRSLKKNFKVKVKKEKKNKLNELKKLKIKK